MDNHSRKELDDTLAGREASSAAVTMWELAASSLICETIAYELRNKDENGSQPERGAASGNEHGQHAKQNKAADHGKRGRNIQRMINPQSHQIQVTAEKVEEKVVADSFPWKMRIFGWEIEPVRKGRDQCRMGRKVAENRIAGVDHVAACMKGIIERG